MNKEIILKLVAELLQEPETNFNILDFNFTNGLLSVRAKEVKSGSIYNYKIEIKDHKCAKLISDDFVCPICGSPALLNEYEEGDRHSVVLECTSINNTFCLIRIELGTFDGPHFEEKNMRYIRARLNQR